ncbi:MAG: poly-gamma-glutamate system protein [Deltaproteobacteria bacterium]|nr:poly-gamma-glutamate system protein [Deltaproteobacteria bacterium]MBW2626751.1 poly-gamma-glutamate system protein [Deltaproteobacteria bacterium]
MYWKPEGASQVQRALVAALAVVGLVAVEVFPTEEQQPHYAEKMLAARKAQDALDVIHDASARRGLYLRAKTDPAASRLIGEVLSPITSGSGSLVSKQTSVNPNFAAVLVQWLKDLRIKSGDVVAVGVSGSFPSMNIAVYSALHELGVEPIIISSTAASQWGANDPNFTWLDMEAVLRKNEIFPYKSVAASLGGVGDDAIGLTKRGRRMLERAIERNEIPLLADIEPEKKKAEIVDEEEGQPAPNLALVDEDRVRERMRVYYEMAGDRAIDAYINVGGGTVSVGTKVGKRKFLPGVNARPPKGIQEMPPSVLGAFLESGVPGIHVTRIIDLAEEYGLEIAPRITPEPGTGDVFQKRQPNRWLAGIVMALILLSLFVVARAPWGTRMLRTTIPPESILPPPPRTPSGFVPRADKHDGNGTATDPP